MNKRKLSLFAKIFGKKYFIKTTDDLKEDEVLFFGRKIYIKKR